MNTNNNSNNNGIKTESIPNKKGNLIKILIIAVFMIAGLFCAYKVGAYMTKNPQATNISNVFVDINGDGKPDLIVNAEVILNTDQSASFLASQVQK